MCYREACLFLLVGTPAFATPVEVERNPTSATCPVTISGEPFTQPSSPPRNRFWYGTEGLAVLLNRSGTWQGMGMKRNYRDKLFWWRQGYVGATEQRPELIVSGRMLDGNAPPANASRATNAYHKDFGGWAMLVMVEFPSSGCWEVTGQYRGQTANFVVYVGP